MRKFLSAGVLAAAATMALLPTFSAQASPTHQQDPDTTWTYVDDYDDLEDCIEAGVDGAIDGDWDHYVCDLSGHAGEWQLYVSDHDDDDNNNGDNDNGNDG